MSDITCSISALPNNGNPLLGWMRKTPSASQASLGKAGAGLPSPHSSWGPPSGPPGERWLLLALCPERAPFLGRPQALLALPLFPSWAHLSWAGWFTSLEQEEQGLVRRMEEHLGGDLSSLESSEDFFASQEMKYLWASCIIPVLFLRTNYPQNFWTDWFHYLKVQVKLMLVETNCHGWVKTNKTQQHRSRIWNQDTRENWSWLTLRRQVLPQPRISRIWGLQRAK